MLRSTKSKITLPWQHWWASPAALACLYGKSRHPVCTQVRLKLSVSPCRPSVPVPHVV